MQEYKLKVSLIPLQLLSLEALPVHSSEANSKTESYRGHSY